MSPIRVLQITDCISHGSGVSAVIMNYYRHIDSSKVIFDFMVNEPVEDDLRTEIEKNGSKIFVMPSLALKNTVRYKKELESFFRNNSREYSIIHGHTPNAAAYYMPVAKKYGVPIRILHSHNSRGADSTLKRIRNRLMSRMAIASATDRFACSKVAADYLYGNDSAFILNNAIDIDSYSFNGNIRNKIREQFKIADDTILIGHIGRMVPQKNHRFIIDIAAVLKEKQIDAKFILIGDGPLRNELQQRIQDKNLEDSFIFTGVVGNAKDYYNAMDVFILPSLYEGLPVVGVEAQAAGLPTLVSDKVTPETLIVENIQAMDIISAEDWAQWIIDNSGLRQDNCCVLSKKGFNIKIEAEKLTQKYIEMLR